MRRLPASRPGVAGRPRATLYEGHSRGRTLGMQAPIHLPGRGITTRIESAERRRGGFGPVESSSPISSLSRGGGDRLPGAQVFHGSIRPIYSLAK